jgi:Holliday junction resolvasome RuvABC endonuclease subunit
VRLLAIDPGTTESGSVWFRDGRLHDSAIMANADLLTVIRTSRPEEVAIEMIASYGMAVGREVFETCVWIGRLQQVAEDIGARVTLIYRRDVKLHLCGNPRAKDPNIRQALIDLIGPQGTKKAPGPTYGVKSHAWAALGVAATHLKLAAHVPRDVLAAA